MESNEEDHLDKKSPHRARVFGHRLSLSIPTSNRQASTCCPSGFSPDASAKFTSREYYRLSVLESVPRFAKILIPLLTILNLLLSVWIYEEYVNNRFLRIYVNDSLQASGAAAIVLLSIGFLAIAAMVLFTKL